MEKRDFQMVFRKGKGKFVTPPLAKVEVVNAITESGVTGLIDILQYGRPISCKDTIVIFRAAKVIQAMSNPESN